MKSLLEKRLSAAVVGVKAFIFLWATKLQVCRCAANCKCLCAVASGRVCTGVHTDSSLCVFVCQLLFCVCLLVPNGKKRRGGETKTVDGNEFSCGVTGEAPAVVGLFFPSALETWPCRTAESIGFQLFTSEQLNWEARFWGKRETAAKSCSENHQSIRRSCERWLLLKGSVSVRLWRRSPRYFHSEISKDVCVWEPFNTLTHYTLQPVCVCVSIELEQIGLFFFIKSRWIFTSHFKYNPSQTLLHCAMRACHRLSGCCQSNLPNHFNRISQNLSQPLPLCAAATTDRCACVCACVCEVDACNCRLVYCNTDNCFME